MSAVDGVPTAEGRRWSTSMGNGRRRLRGLPLLLNALLLLCWAEQVWAEVFRPLIAAAPASSSPRPTRRPGRRGTPRPSAATAVTPSAPSSPALGSAPAPVPTRRPRVRRTPTHIPSSRPDPTERHVPDATSSRPSRRPTQTPLPTAARQMTARPSSPHPTGRPSLDPATFGPSPVPTSVPTREPTSPGPTAPPSWKPTTGAPTAWPTRKPSSQPTARLTEKPSSRPTVRPTEKPSLWPTARPTRKPSPRPTARPTEKLSLEPAVRPTTPLPRSPAPTAQPSVLPATRPPTMRPTPAPTPRPTPHPTPRQPTPGPTPLPSPLPTTRPTPAPTPRPMLHPTSRPTPGPTPLPSPLRTTRPTREPTRTPTLRPSPEPSSPPMSSQPTPEPAARPTTTRPTPEPTARPSPHPTLRPTQIPTHPRPTREPTAGPTPGPTTPSPSSVAPTPSFLEERQTASVFLKLNVQSRMNRAVVRSFEGAARDLIIVASSSASLSSAQRPREEEEEEEDGLGVGVGDEEEMEGSGGGEPAVEVNITSASVISQVVIRAPSPTSTAHLVVELSVSGMVRLPFHLSSPSSFSFAEFVRRVFVRDFRSFEANLARTDPFFLPLLGEEAQTEEEGGTGEGEEREVEEGGEKGPLTPSPLPTAPPSCALSQCIKDRGGAVVGDGGGGNSSTAEAGDSAGTAGEEEPDSVVHRDEFFVKLVGVDGVMNDSDEDVFEWVTMEFLTANLPPLPPSPLRGSPDIVAVNVTDVEVTAQSLVVSYSWGRRTEEEEQQQEEEEDIEEEVEDGIGEGAATALVVQFDVEGSMSPPTATIADFVEAVLGALLGEGGGGSASFDAFGAALANGSEYFSALRPSAAADDGDGDDNYDRDDESAPPTLGPTDRPRSTTRPSSRPSLSVDGPTAAPSGADTEPAKFGIFDDVEEEASSSSSRRGSLRPAGITLVSLAGIAAAVLSSLIVVRMFRRRSSRQQHWWGGSRPEGGSDRLGAKEVGAVILGRSGNNLEDDYDDSAETQPIESVPSTPNSQFVAPSTPGSQIVGQSTPNGRQFVARSLDQVASSNASALSVIDIPPLDRDEGGSVEERLLQQDSNAAQMGPISTPEKPTACGEVAEASSSNCSSSCGGSGSLEVVATVEFGSSCDDASTLEEDEMMGDDERDIVTGLSRSFEEGIAFDADSDDDFEAAVALASARINSARLGMIGRKGRREDLPHIMDRQVDATEIVRGGDADAGLLNDDARDICAHDTVEKKLLQSCSRSGGDGTDDSSSVEAIIEEDADEVGHPASYRNEDRLFMSLATAVVACRGTSSALHTC